MKSFRIGNQFFEDIEMWKKRKKKGRKCSKKYSSLQEREYPPGERMDIVVLDSRRLSFKFGVSTLCIKENFILLRSYVFRTNVLPFSAAFR